MEEFTKDFWLEVQRDFLKSQTYTYICHASGLFEYYWEKPDGIDHKAIKLLAHKFLSETNNTNFIVLNGTLFFATSLTSKQLRQIRLQFLEWVINNTKD